MEDCVDKSKISKYLEYFFLLNLNRFKRILFKTVLEKIKERGCLRPLNYGLSYFHAGLTGFALLFGIIVNNSILLMDLIMKSNEHLEETILSSIRMRTSPVLMTAFGTPVGMIPIVFS